MDISRVVARVNVPQAEASAVRVGQPAEVVDHRHRPAGPGQGDGGQPRDRCQQHHRAGLGAGATTPARRLKPGAAVHAKIVAEIFKAATVVPAAAILPGEEGGTAVLVIELRLGGAPAGRCGWACARATRCRS